MSLTPSTSALQAPNAAGSSRPDVLTHQIDLLSWVPYSTRTILADYLLRGHPYCIRYAISSWPESVLPVDDWEYFEFLPATTPCLSTVVLRLPSYFRLEVRSSSEFVTVADVLRALYDVRAHFPNAITFGLSYAGLGNYFNVHFEL